MITPAPAPANRGADHLFPTAPNAEPTAGAGGHSPGASRGYTNRNNQQRPPGEKPRPAPGTPCCSAVHLELCMGATSPPTELVVAEISALSSLTRGEDLPRKAEWLRKAGPPKGAFAAGAGCGGGGGDGAEPVAGLPEGSSLILGRLEPAAAQSGPLASVEEETGVERGFRGLGVSW